MLRLFPQTLLTLVAFAGLGLVAPGISHTDEPDAQRAAKDHPHSPARLEKACEEGDPGGCLLLGHMYRDGRDVAQDFDRARSLFEKACELGGPRPAETTIEWYRAVNGCAKLVYMYQTGEGGVKDPQAVRRYLQKMCDMGSHHACAMVQR